MTTSDNSILINGEPGRLLDVTDRGLAYGDGVFETMLCIDGRIPLLSRHLSRLEMSCDALGIGSAQTRVWESDIDRVLDAGGLRERSIVKLMATRGSGGRGYTPSSDAQATRIVQRLGYTETSVTDDLHCDVLETRLGSSRQLAGIKHLNRLEQVLAAKELSERKLDEGLVCNQHGFLIEAVSSNVILVFDERVVTPKLDTAGVRGVMRDYLVEKSDEAGFKIDKDYVFSSAIEQANEIILCNSVRGVRRIARLGERVLEHRSVYDRLRAFASKAFEPMDQRGA